MIQFFGTRVWSKAIVDRCQCLLVATITAKVNTFFILFSFHHFAFVFVFDEIIFNLMYWIGAVSPTWSFSFDFLIVDTCDAPKKFVFVEKIYLFIIMLKCRYEFASILFESNVAAFGGALSSSIGLLVEVYIQCSLFSYLHCMFCFCYFTQVYEIYSNYKLSFQT